jgi:aspartate-semialdehyde dehydrogenase
VLDAGLRTGDIMTPGCRQVDTAGMGDALCEALLAGLIERNERRTGRAGPVSSNWKSGANMSKTYDVAVVGATGAVGECMLDILASRNFPVGKVYALASERSAGKTEAFGRQELEVENLADFDFGKVQIGLFSPGASVSAVYAPKAGAAGCVVIDNTSQFRYDDDIPLVVPEVNGGDRAVPQPQHHRQSELQHDPDAGGTQAHLRRGGHHADQRVHLPGGIGHRQGGDRGTGDPDRQPAERSTGGAKVYPKQIAFNVLPQIDVFQDNGYTKEEMKMVWETRKIMGDDSIEVNPTCVRVPVFYGHSEAVHIETRDKITAAEAQRLLAAAPGVVLMDERKPGGYPTPVGDASGTGSGVRRAGARGHLASAWTRPVGGIRQCAQRCGTQQYPDRGILDRTLFVDQYSKPLSAFGGVTRRQHSRSVRIKDPR